MGHGYGLICGFLDGVSEILHVGFGGWASMSIALQLFWFMI